ncbi:RHS repeat-associated core domain-containing protein [Actinophytocola gossypii]|uniref:GIY-YIG nuclease family protein n=1 Tax=Actinophytocola gossypii TaxID=2812003 RepID=A0ABT2JJJ6_9PSEU|nr:RHS repeat-associated core domain-containing protein [Actinophytocola gossypii]MCT2587913.1 GIY-YIG nuclease family protein [Actinophytocola gossypii]
MRLWRSGALFLSAALAATLVQVTLPPVASAQSGPSVPLPPVSSVGGSQAGRDAPASTDETSEFARDGEQTVGEEFSAGGGTYTATSLKPSATWQVSGQTGDFTWSYPLPVPPAPGGLVPQLGLSYSSGAVDGLTSATNNQASWVGDGWSLWPGFIERRYRGCGDDLDGVADPKPADLCWHTDNATLSLNGSGSELVRVGTSSVWKPKSDDGSRVERLTNGDNADDNNETWKVTTVDGTQYFYGSSAASKSTWTVPVFGDDANEPCHAATFAGSWCTQAYRWNLDKVVDRHGNMIRYHYQTETNFYGRNKNSAATQYVRGGWLDRVDYGLRADDPSVPAAGQMTFTVADRCVPGSDCTLDKPLNLPDVPLDLRCTGGTCEDTWSPTFWTTKKLTTVTTKARVSGQLATVDSWKLRHIMPDPGDGEKAALWLKGITHTGHTGTAISLPEVTFDGVRMPNRVHGVDGYSALIRFRMNAIVSEAGGVTSIRYAEPDCVHGSSMPANAHTNTKRCFPVRWTPPMSPERTDYFHKYVVESINEYDGVAGTLAVETAYEYLGGAAWHWNTSEFVKEDKKTWDEFRGFNRIRIRKGSGEDGPRTMTEQRFHRGMHGDKLPNGTRSVTVPDSENVSRTDSDWLRGFQYETATFAREAPSTAPVPVRLTKTISTPFVHGPTATRGPFKSYIVRSGVAKTYTVLAAGGRRVTSTETTYDTTYGLPTSVNDVGDIATDIDDLCTTTTYTPNTTRWLIDFPTRVETVSLRCGQTPEFPADAVSDTRTFYDGHTNNTPPTIGNATEVRVAASRPASGPVYVTTGSSEYDDHGRVTAATDALGNTTTTAYTPALGGPTTQVVTTTPGTDTVPEGLSTTTTYDPRRGQPTLIEDPNTRPTEITYDALGRTTEVWLANRRKSQHANGNHRFSYQIRKNGPNVITTTTLRPNGNYTTNHDLYDGLLRKRQTQTPAPGGGRLLSDIRYDSHGRPARVTQPYYNGSSVNTQLWLPFENSIPGMTVSLFDGAGRPVSQAFHGYGEKRWETTTTYGGDRTTVTPPQGGTRTTTITDARGRTTELRQHGPDGFQATTYTYTPAGDLKTVTDPGDNVWTYDYDLRGRKIAEDDPDRGQSTYTYDNANQLLSSTDARGATLVYSYDALGRKTTLHRDSTTGTRLADWTYDTVPFAKGQPATATRYVGAAAYTTRVTGYSPLYQPGVTEVDIPAAEGNLAGTYTSYLTYRPDGSLGSESYPEAGDLAEESVVYDYNDLGLPDGTRGGIDSTVDYVLGTNYTRYGEPQRLTLGQDTQRAWLSYYYEDDTRRLERTVVDAEIPRPMVADYHYTYDDAGNVLSMADTPINQPADTQCFRYDHLRRLTEAWTPAAGCDAEPTRVGLGGPAPYWHTFAYDEVGNRTTETQHGLSGDTTRTYASTGHRLNSVTTADSGGTRLEEFGYDAVGNTTSRSVVGEEQTLEWDAEGHLNKVTTEAGAETTFVYTPGGDRLIRRDPQAVTLYLGNQEIRLDRQSGVRTGTRYYAHGGQTVAVRKGSGLSWLAGDRNGTAEVSINQNTLDVTRRRHQPFGAPRGAAPVGWPGERGFVGGTIDTSTGLTHLGAREYDPALGRFVSVDPLMDLADSQQMHGYAYANNSPMTFTDPSGLYYICGGGPGGDCPYEGPLWTTNPDKAQEYNDKAQDKSGVDPDAAARDVYMNSPILGQSIDPSLLAYFKKNKYKGSARFSRLEALEFALQSDVGWRIVCQIQNGAADECMPDVWGDGLVNLMRFVYELTPVPDAVDCLGGSAESCAWLAASAVPGARLLRGIDNAADAARTGVRSCKTNSFVPGTEVLLADGASKPIDDVEVGDLVLATDPVTGETGPREVVATIVGQGRKNLVEVTIDTDGPTGDQTGTVTATANHPFWIDNHARWIHAEDLRTGDDLRVAGTSQGEVLATRPYITHQRVHNLTINDIHTYHVLVTDVPVLVHNCDNSGVYVFTEKRSGLPYVGQTNNFDRRLKEHVRTGKRDADGHVICIHVCGDKDAREAVEADVIELLGGKENLANDVNSPGLRRRSS